MNAPFIRDDIAPDVPVVVMERLRALRQDAADCAALADAGRGSDAPGDLAERRARANAASQVLMRCQQHVERYSGALQEAAPVKVDLAPGETAIAALAACRQAIEVAKAALKAVRTAPVSGTETKARIRETVAAAAERGRPMIETKNGSLVIAWPRSGVAAPRLADDYAPTFGPIDIVAMLGWLDPERLIEKLEAEVDARFGQEGLTDAERQERQTALEADLLNLERKEETLIGMCRLAGSIVSRRSSADPRAVLNVL